MAYRVTKILCDMLIRARLEKEDDEDNYHDYTSVHDSRPDSPTLHTLEDLVVKVRTRGFFFTSHPY